MKTETYIADEPVEETIYRDKWNAIHFTRDAAIRANFQHDVAEAINAVAEAVTCEVDYAAVFWNFVANHPDMVRAMLGDRDPT